MSNVGFPPCRGCDCGVTFLLVVSWAVRWGGVLFIAEYTLAMSWGFLNWFIEVVGTCSEDLRVCVCVQFWEFVLGKFTWNSWCLHFNWVLKGTKHKFPACLFKQRLNIVHIYRTLTLFCYGQVCRRISLLVKILLLISMAPALACWVAFGSQPSFPSPFRRWFCW